MTQEALENRRDQLGFRIRKGKANYAILRIRLDLTPEMVVVDGHKSRLPLQAEQYRNGIVFYDCLRSQLVDETNCPAIPGGNLNFQPSSKQLFIQYDHQAAANSGKVVRNCLVT